MNKHYKSPPPESLSVKASSLLSGFAVILILIGWAVVRLISELDHARWLNSFIFVALYTGALPATIGLITAMFSSIRYFQIDGYIFALEAGGISFFLFMMGLNGLYGFIILCVLQIIACAIFLNHMNKIKKSL